MTSHQTRTARTELGEHFSEVMRAARAIRSEAALTISESSSLRVAARQARMDTVRIRERNAAQYRRSLLCQAERPLQLAQVVAEMLAVIGYSAFIAEPAKDYASVQ